MLIAASTLFLSFFAEAATATPPQPAAKPNENNKVICRRYKETGSLIATKRVCHTRQDWMKLNENIRGDMDRFNQQSGHSRPAG
jgi:hypothetical protein